MKTREPPPESANRPEESEPAETEMHRFRTLARKVVSVDRKKVVAAEKKAKAKKPKS